MKVKVIKRAWYNERFYDPETQVSDIIIELPEEKLPSWAVAVDEKDIKKEVIKEDDNLNEVQCIGGEEEAEEEIEEIAEEDNRKVKDLALVEKNTLLEEAKAVGITGNNLLGFKVITLKNKIAKAKEEIGE